MMKQADGTWTGVAAELWADVARREKLEWRLVEGEPGNLVAGRVAVQHFEEFRSPDDRHRVRVVVVESSSEVEYARRNISAAEWNAEVTPLFSSRQN
jgi:hypothetical protein